MSDVRDWSTEFCGWCMLFVCVCVYVGVRGYAV
jgi:hypothetical protein